MLNKVMLIGRLGRDPEIKTLQSGASMTTFNLATDESWIDRNGQKNEHTEWHRIITFQRLAENCANHIHKGSLVYVEGSLQTRKWTDVNGQNRQVTEIKAQRVLFLDRRRPEQNGEGASEEEWGGNGRYSYDRFNSYDNGRDTVDPLYSNREEKEERQFPSATIISTPDQAGTRVAGSEGVRFPGMGGPLDEGDAPAPGKVEEASI